MILYAEKYGNCMTESVGRIILSYSKDNNSYKNNTSSNSYKSYDDGYDDVYMYGDYDDDRYNSDSDYADDVDDVIEDDYEEGMETGRIHDSYCSHNSVMVRSNESILSPGTWQIIALHHV